MDKLAGLLHLCNKAGKLAFGRVAVCSSADRGEVALALITCDCGNDLRRKLSRVDTITSDWTSDKLGEIFERNRLSVVGIKDRGFADEISSLMKTGYTEKKIK
jgi:ribosomal protein L7Ae-like RNA K-turn-binding protein